MTFELMDACCDKMSDAAQVRCQMFTDIIWKALMKLDIGLDFNWPTMHMALQHAVSGMRDKGPANNYQKGLGEALHPAMKQDFQLTNKHTDYEKQVCGIHTSLPSFLTLYSFFAGLRSAT